MSTNLTPNSGPLAQGQIESIPGDKAIPSSSASFTTALSYVDAGFSVIPIEPNEPKLPVRDFCPGRSTHAPERADLRGRCSKIARPHCKSSIGGTRTTSSVRQALPLFAGEFPAGSRSSISTMRPSPWSGSTSWPQGVPGCWLDLPVVLTPRPGFHVYYRRDGGKAGGSHKLAQGAGPAQPSKPTTLIEMKGEGGYVLAPGCTAACHETGRLYVTWGNPAVTEVPVIDDSARETLLDAARSLNRWTVEPRRVPPQCRRQVAPHYTQTRGRLRGPRGLGQPAGAGGLDVRWFDF